MTSFLPYVTGPRSSWEHLAGTPILRWPGDVPGIGDVSLTITLLALPPHQPSLPSIHLPSPARPTASLLPPPPSTLTGNLSGVPVACHHRQLAQPPPARSPHGEPR